MSSHLYVADAAVAADYALAQNIPAIDCANYNGLTALELSTLWAIMENAEWDVRMMRQFPIAVAANVGERIILEVPSPVVDRLATLSMDEIGRIAQAWAGTLEMAGRADQVSRILVDLVRLATRSRDTKRRLFLANRFERR